MGTRGKRARRCPEEVSPQTLRARAIGARGEGAPGDRSASGRHLPSCRGGRQDICSRCKTFGGVLAVTTVPTRECLHLSVRVQVAGEICEEASLSRRICLMARLACRLLPSGIGSINLCDRGPSCISFAVGTSSAVSR